jgi:hypothetical protein
MAGATVLRAVGAGGESTLAGDRVASVFGDGADGTAVVLAAGGGAADAGCLGAGSANFAANGATCCSHR